MNLKQIAKAYQSSDYDFMRTDPHLGDHLILVGLGGSHAYGTNNENSDLDIRGVATRSKAEILTGKDFEQVTESEVTDTVIYSFDKMVRLLCGCNPNTIELMGLKREHYLQISPIGELLLKNKQLFLSQRAVYSFAGFANTQLRRLDNKSARTVPQSQHEAHILKSIEHGMLEFPTRYAKLDEGAVKLYLDRSEKPGMEREIFADLHLNHYPLRDARGLISDMSSVISTYDKHNSGEREKVESKRLSKHMMHLVRLYYMCFDILEKGEIVTYREKEHDFLMQIRSGAYLDAENQPTEEFRQIAQDLNAKLEQLQTKTDLPKQVDMEKVDRLIMEVNEMALDNAR